MNFNLTESERERILNLHKERTKTHYVILEQEQQPQEDRLRFRMNRIDFYSINGKPFWFNEDKGTWHAFIDNSSYENIDFVFVDGPSGLREKPTGAYEWLWDFNTQCIPGFQEGRVLSISLPVVDNNNRVALVQLSATEYNNEFISDPGLGHGELAKGKSMKFGKTFMYSGKYKYALTLKDAVQWVNYPTKAPAAQEQPKQEPLKPVDIGQTFGPNLSVPNITAQNEEFKPLQEYLAKGGKLSKITIKASASVGSAGYVENNKANGLWKDNKQYDNVPGNNDKQDGNLQLTKARATNTKNKLMELFPQLKNVPFELEGLGVTGGNTANPKDPGNAQFRKVIISFQ